MLEDCKSVAQILQAQSKALKLLEKLRELSVEDQTKACFASDILTCERKVLIRRKGPAEVEQRCPEPTTCSAWRLELSPQPHLNFLEKGSKGWLYMRDKTAQKIYFT